LLQKDELHMQETVIELEEAEQQRDDRNVAVAKRNNICANLPMRNNS